MDLYTGNIIWKAPFEEQWSTYLAPLVVTDTVFMGGSYYGGMYAYDADSGATKWRIDLPSWLNWTPSYANQTVYSWVAGSLYAVRAADHKVLWHEDLNPYYSGSMKINAAVVADGMVFVTDSQNVLYAVDQVTGSLHWKRSGNYSDTMVAYANGVIYALNGGVLEALTADYGALLWTFRGDHQISNQPLVVGNRLYLASTNHTYIIDLQDFRMLWTTNYGGWLTVANGFLYIATPDHAVYAYRAQEP